MVILGIETSSRVCGLSLSEAAPGGLTPIGQIGLNIPNAHSERIMTLLDALLQSAGLDKSHLKAIAVSLGPGSFTGLRIGLSTAKGLAYGLDIPLVGVPTLDVIAEPFRFVTAPLIIATVSRKKEYYCCKYSSGERLMDYSVMSEDELVASVKEGDTVISDAGEDLKSQIREGAIVLDNRHSYPDAYYVSVLGYKKLALGIHDPMDTLVPMYVQGFRGTKHEAKP